MAQCRRKASISPAFEHTHPSVSFSITARFAWVRQPGGREVFWRIALSSYAKQKFWGVGFLATNDQNIQKRPGGAALSLLVLKPEDLPADLREDFNVIMQELKGGAAGRGRAIEETTGALSSEQCKEIARGVVNIFTDLLGGL
jgi:hypothetical protein